MDSTANGSKALFKNYEEILHGPLQHLRRDALAIVESGIKSAIPYHSVKEKMRLKGDILTIDSHTFDLSAYDRILVIGVGKGAYPIAMALEECLGNRIDRGFVAVKDSGARKLEHIRVFPSSHPIPDERSVSAGEIIREMLCSTTEKDLILAPITGGSSALVNLPPEEISIGDLAETNRLLLECGATIGEINTVRKHLCRLKGGGFLRAAQPAHVVTITLDTAPPDMPWPDLVLPDETTFSDALNVIRQYDLTERIPQSVMQYLKDSVFHAERETLKTLSGLHQTLVYTTSPFSCCMAARREAERLGYHAMILSSCIEGEAKDFGIGMAGVAREIHRNGIPLPAPCAVISGGETTVTIQDAAGYGGPNQECVLGFAWKAQDCGNAVFVSVDTDGTDGPTDLAGGICDSNTRNEMTEAGVDIKDCLNHHDAGTGLQKAHDHIITGHTGTNVMNLRVLLVE